MSWGWRIERDYLSVQFWTFHTIPSKKLFCHFPPSPHYGVGIERDYFSVQFWTFHAIPSKKKTFCPLPPSPCHGDGGLKEITYLYSSGHFILFLAKNIFATSPHLHVMGWWIERDYSSVQFWTFHAIPSKKHFVHFPSPCHGEGGLKEIILLCSSGYFMLFLAKKNSSNLTSTPMRGEQTWTFNADLDISFNSCKEGLTNNLKALEVSQNPLCTGQHEVP